MCVLLCLHCRWRRVRLTCLRLARTSSSICLCLCHMHWLCCDYFESMIWKCFPSVMSFVWHFVELVYGLVDEGMHVWIARKAIRYHQNIQHVLRLCLGFLYVYHPWAFGRMDSSSSKCLSVIWVTRRCHRVAEHILASIYGLWMSNMRSPWTLAASLEFVRLN